MGFIARVYGEDNPKVRLIHKHASDPIHQKPCPHTDLYGFDSTPWLYHAFKFRYLYLSFSLV